MTSRNDYAPAHELRAEIARTLTPVHPLAPPSRRAWMLLPLGLSVAASAPLLGVGRFDLGSMPPLVTWGLTGLQALLGLWILALGFRESVPGQNLSRGSIGVAVALTVLSLLGVTIVTNASSPTRIPTGRELQFWIECIYGPMVLGVPFMLVATLLAARACPTRPAVTGSLCGLAAGIVSDAGWRLGCFVSSPGHVLNSHDVAIVLLTAAGSLLAVALDSGRWRRLRR
jgi:hypothetical protein